MYTIHAYRWGDHENHSYILTIHSDKDEAIRIAEEHENYRGGKYECEIIEWTAVIDNNEIIYNKGDIVKKISGD